MYSSKFTTDSRSRIRTSGRPARFKDGGARYTQVGCNSLDTVIGCRPLAYLELLALRSTHHKVGFNDLLEDMVMNKEPDMGNQKNVEQ